MTTHPNEAMYPLDENRFGGLTKREHFALEAYKVLLTRENYRDVGLMTVSTIAVDAADALIDRLNSDFP